MFGTIHSRRQQFVGREGSKIGQICWCLKWIVPFATIIGSCPIGTCGGHYCLEMLSIWLLDIEKFESTLVYDWKLFVSVQNLSKQLEKWLIWIKIGLFLKKILFLCYFVAFKNKVSGELHYLKLNNLSNFSLVGCQNAFFILVETLWRGHMVMGIGLTIKI